MLAFLGWIGTIFSMGERLWPIAQILGRLAYVTWAIFAYPTTALFLLLLTAAGLALYVLDRKGFLGRMRGRKIASTLLAIFGFIQMVESVVYGIITLFFSLWYLDALGGLVFLLSLALFGLPLISGILWFVDGSRVYVEIEDNLRALKQKIDFEEAWKKYPKNLFAKYVEKYPHNPSGVLEWHIHKKMKEGKTREQAIEELNLEIT
jgi:hypothetical protein